jgi:hypothetical protein
MKLAVSFDNEGKIIGMFDPESGRGDFGTLRYRPTEDENHYILEVPGDLTAKPIGELSELLRVNTSGASPRLELRSTPTS